MVASPLPRRARSRVEYRVGHIAYRAIWEIMSHSCDQSKFRGADIVGNVLARFGQDQSVDIPMENNGRCGNPAQAFATADTKAYAAFADFTYAATDALALTAGGRYSLEKKKASYSATTPLVALQGKEEFENFSPRLVTRYSLADSTNIYASWSRGFKSGVFNTQASAVSVTDPEHIEAWEIGFKTRQRPIGFEVSAYTYDWRDIQVARYDPTRAA